MCVCAYGHAHVCACLCVRSVSYNPILYWLIIDLSRHHLLPYIYIYIYIYSAFSRFAEIFEQAFTIVVDMLLLYLWDDWPMFIISDSNEQLKSELEYSLLKPYCHRWWISKMQSGREDNLEEWYAKKYCFKLGKKATETHGMLQTAFGPSCMNRASVFEWHKRFKEGRGVFEGWWEVWEE